MYKETDTRIYLIRSDIFKVKLGVLYDILDKVENNFIVFLERGSIDKIIFFQVEFNHFVLEFHQTVFSCE